MGFMKKLKFWKKRKLNISPTMVDVGVSTERPGRRDVGTMTEYVLVGRAKNINEAPAVEHAERCESFSYGRRPAEHVGWCELYSYEGTSNGKRKMLPVICIQRTSH